MRNRVWILTVGLLLWCCDLMAQDWVVADSLVSDSIAVADSADYDMPVQRRQHATRVQFL